MSIIWTGPGVVAWARLKPGASTTFEGYQVADGVKQQLRMTARLVSKHEDRLLVERTYVPLGGGQNEPLRLQQFLVEAMIDPAEHPFTSTTAKISELPAETLTIGGKSLSCRVRTVQAAGEFPEYGRGVWATVAQNETIPGGMARVWLKSSKGNQPFEFRGDVVAYETR